MERGCVMDTSEPGSAAEEEEEKAMEPRPRTRSNPEGAEDRALSAQASVGNRSEGEGEAASADDSPQATAAPDGTAWPGPAPHAEVQVKTPRVNCPEKVVSVCREGAAPGPDAGVRGWRRGEAQPWLPPRRSSAWTWRRRWLCPNWSPSTGECRGAGAGTPGDPGSAVPGPSWGRGVGWGDDDAPVAAELRPPPRQVQDQRAEHLPEDDRDVREDEAQDRQVPRVRAGGGEQRRHVGEPGPRGRLRVSPPTPPSHPGSSQLSGFTSDPREVCSCLYDLETVVCKSFSIPPLGRGGRDPARVPSGVQTGSLGGANGVPRA